MLFWSIDHVTVGTNAVFFLDRMDTVILSLIPTQTNSEKKTMLQIQIWKLPNHLWGVLSESSVRTGHPSYEAVCSQNVRGVTHTEKFWNGSRATFVDVHEWRNLQTWKDKLLAGFVTKFCRKSFAKWAFHHPRWKLSMQCTLSRPILTVWQSQKGADSWYIPTLISVPCDWQYFHNQSVIFDSINWSHLIMTTTSAQHKYS